MALFHSVTLRLIAMALFSASFLLQPPLTAAYSLQIRPPVNRYHSFESFQRRTQTVVVGIGALGLSASDDNVDNSGNNQQKKKGMLKGALEGAVRQVTGETQYKLGLLGEKTDTSGETNNSTYKYQFGDLTKAVLAEFGVLTNAAAVNATNNATEIESRKSPRLKDLERSVISEWKKPLEEKDLPFSVMQQFFAQLDTKQRINLILQGCQYAAEGVVLWGFITNLCTIFASSLAWSAALVSSSSLSSSSLPLLPINIGRDLWRTFVAKFIGCHLVLSPFFLIVQALGTLIGFRRFHSYIQQLSASRWITNGPWRDYESPVLYRAIAVISAFFITNIAVSSVIAGTAFATISLCLQLSALVVANVKLPF